MIKSGRSSRTLVCSAAMITVAALLGSCVSGSGSDESIPIGQATSNSKEESVMEKIGNPFYNSDYIGLSVVSNGCTKPSDFVVEHNVNDGRCELTIVRTQPDLCRKVTSIVDIQLEWKLPEDCNGMEVTFANPELKEGQKPFVRQLETE